MDACGGFLAGKSILFLSGSLPADWVWWSSRIWWYFLLQSPMLPPLCFTWRWCACGWCAAFAASKHHAAWSTNIFVSSGQRPNFLPGDLGVSYMPFVEFQVRFQQKPLNLTPSKLLLVKNQAVWPIWATEALTSFKVVAASLRFLLSCCVSLWGQQLRTELNLLLHLMAVTGLWRTSGEMKLLQHLLTLTFQLILSMSCWVSSLSSFCSRNTEEAGQESMDF